MIDKRINFRFGGGYQGGPAGGVTSGGSSGRDRGMGTAGKTGNYSAPTSTGGGNQFTSVTSGTLSDPREKQDFFTQSYTAPGIFGLGGGYRDLNVPGDTQSGFKSRLGGIGGAILGGILGLINPALGLGFRAVNYLKGEIPETFNQFKESATLEEFRDKVRGYGRTMPTVSPNPMFGGIESLAVNPQITRDLFAFNPGSVKDRALKQQYGIYNATGMMNPNMIDLMKQDIELNKQKGTPLSLPAEAYSLIG